MRSPHTFNQVFARLGFAVVFLAMACLIGRAELGEHDPTWTAPARAARRTNPLAGRLDAAPGGRKLFHERCATCHGDDARGSKKGPDLTAADVQAQSDGALFWKITQGNTRGGMPSFSFLPEPQRWQLVLHVRAHWASSPERPSEPGSQPQR